MYLNLWATNPIGCHTDQHPIPERKNVMPVFGVHGFKYTISIVYLNPWTALLQTALRFAIIQKEEKHEILWVTTPTDLNTQVII